jgi:hypothetical protein
MPGSVLVLVIEDHILGRLNDYAVDREEFKASRNPVLAGKLPEGWIGFGSRQQA